MWKWGAIGFLLGALLAAALLRLTTGEGRAGESAGPVAALRGWGTIYGVNMTDMPPPPPEPK